MKIDISRIRRHIETLAGFTATPGAGTTRLSYTPEYRQACDYLIDHARSLGLTARLDAIGNLRIRLEGRNRTAPTVVVGSHLDSVINGGDFDGILGVVSGVEAVQCMVENGLQPEHAVEAISFVEEEGTTFRCPLTGSKALAGELGLAELEDLKNEDGESLPRIAADFGLEPAGLESDRLQAGGVKAMFELHIEQGAVLESLGLPVGIVEHIAGSENHRVRLHGRANHAGTTPMSLRFDALACAAECIGTVEHVAADPNRPDTVATVGRIHCSPNAVNVIPAAVEFSIDIRDIRESQIESASSAILDLTRSIAQNRNIQIETELTGKSPPRPMAPGIIENLATLADHAGIPYHRMNSGALHDAAMMTRVTDVGMIFVPSKDGRSHTPKERTDYEDIEQGANLLLRAVLHQAAP
ncbi:MAG: Zn-dependent hydrolase [Gammaproteobacteria bacterium]|nr:Zn-dependent hydrolase [Gammaproteobacteria bacterium]